MRKLLIIGCGGHARPVIDAAKIIDNWDIVGIIDLSYNGEFESVLDVPILGGLDFIKNIEPSSVEFFVAIGKNEQRSELIMRVEQLGFLCASIIHPKAYVSGSAKLGRGIYVGAFAHIGPSSEIANGCIINTHANIEHEVFLDECVQVCPSAVVCGRSKISRNVFIGANATIIDKIFVAPDNVIGAGSVVISDILETKKTIIGVPGRVR